MDISTAQIDAIQRWAESEALIRAVYIFGSRARGDSREDSDLDVALEIKCRPEHVSAWFIANGAYWQDTLRQLTGLLVNLHHLNGEATKIHTAAVEKDGVEIYRSLDPREYDPNVD